MLLSPERELISALKVCPASESWRWYLADPSSDVFLMGLAGRLVPAQASKSPATISIWEPTVVCRHPPQVPQGGAPMTTAQHFQTFAGACCQLRDSGESRSGVCLVELWLRVNCGAAGVRAFCPLHLAPAVSQSNTDGWDMPARGGGGSTAPRSRRRKMRRWT